MHTMKKTWGARPMATALMLAAAFAGAVSDTAFAEGRPAKELFGGMALPAKAAPSPYGSYAKGCIAGAVAIPTDGPTWQAMRLSRNRRWGHPEMIALLERFSKDAVQLGWGAGILIGDISQPRGGPMLSGHASHQIGLDADIWFTPKPQSPLSAQQREDMPFTSMLEKDKFLTVDKRLWTNTHARLVVQAASYPQVERIFVNPAIKKKLCDTWTGDRGVLGKIRPIYGHDAHFHIRMRCPEGAAGCKPQAAVPPGDGCDQSLAWWFTKEPWAAPKKDPDAKPAPKPRAMQVSDLPKACAMVLDARGPANELEVTYRASGGIMPSNSAASAFAAPAPSQQTAFELPVVVPIPAPRPAGW
ncbi:penicillin-insensitive murein endopeptidase [Rhizobium sp. AQ_MP]|uniref:penicillin-insensitive murein endopeptidase n=1 Tax=Rhizobium sp. AQ_MP TaxID=2761536 RepID=UPI00163A2E83|nr:penicillin-insensitive murein endopeptidase [Rhizobium sp. AQ_MP]